MTILIAHGALALVPVLVMLAVFVWLDAFKLVSLGEILVMLALGGAAALIAYLVTPPLAAALPMSAADYTRFVAPWLEEALKGVALVVLFRANRIGFKVDAIIFGFAMGAGFGAVENIVYLAEGPAYGAGTWLVRGLGTAVMHGTTLAVFATIGHELAERETRRAAAEFNFRWWWFVPGYLAAAAIHTAFNQLDHRPLTALLAAAAVAPLAIIGLLALGSAEAQRWLRSESEDHRGQVEALAGGGWPAGPAAPKVEALSARVGRERARDIRRYWELTAWLIAEAEEAFLRETDLDLQDIRAGFAERDALAQALGPATAAALKALLPFSRNDYWELAELRQRLGRT